MGKNERETRVDCTPVAPDYPAAGSTFAKAAWFLADYAGVLETWVFDEPTDETTTKWRGYHGEALSLAVRLKELDGRWEAKRAAGTVESAAEIVCEMLKDWRLPGAVWYLKKAGRWRVTGDGYRPRIGEICVGVYSPGVSVSMLLEDFKEVATGMGVPA